MFSIDAPFLNYQFSVCYLLPTLTSSLNDQCGLTSSSGIYSIPKQSQLVIYVAWSNPSKSFSLKKIIFFNCIFFLGGIPLTFEVLFLNGGSTVFNQTLITSQTTNGSALSGTSSGSPLYRLVLDVESNNLLTVSSKDSL
jgi:hypothetical protein